ncbi:Protein CBG08765, partial [Caenorhabditis briggsae]
LPSEVETVIIFITVGLYMINEFQTVLIAANRFIAMFLPLLYHNLFSNKITMIFLGALYLERGYASVSKVFTVFAADCVLIWESSVLCPLSNDPSCWENFSSSSDGFIFICVTLAVFGVTILLNLMTFAKILRFYLSHNVDSESTFSVKNNIKLFVQTVLQDSLFFVDVLFTFKLSSLSTHRAWLFISTVFVWETIHMLDGLIMLMFSDRVSTLRA